MTRGRRASRSASTTTGSLLAHWHTASGPGRPGESVTGRPPDRSFAENRVRGQGPRVYRRGTMSRTPERSTAHRRPFTEAIDRQRHRPDVITVRLVPRGVVSFVGRTTWSCTGRNESDTSPTEGRPDAKCLREFGVRSSRTTGCEIVRSASLEAESGSHPRGHLRLGGSTGRQDARRGIGRSSSRT